MLIWLMTIACGTEDSLSRELNKAPSITIITHDEAETVPEAEPMSLIAQASDPNHTVDNLNVRWLLNDTVICDIASVDENGESRCEISPTETSTRIIAEVSDPSNATSTDVIELTILINEIPTVEFQLPRQGGQYYESDDVPFYALVDDLEDNPTDLRLTWTSSLDGIIDLPNTANEDGVYEGWAPLSSGNHEITLSVTDTAGNTVSKSHNITVSGNNTPPTCLFLTPSEDLLVSEGDSINFIGFALDEDLSTDLIKGEWLSSIDGLIQPVSLDEEGYHNFQTNLLSPGSHTITFSVWDEVNAGCQQQRNIFVNSRPTVNITSPSNLTVITTDELVRIEADIQDETDPVDALTIQWISNIDGDLGSAQFESDLFVLEHSSLSPGTHTLSVIVTDTRGAIGTDSIEVHINAPPFLESPILLEPAGSNTDLVANIVVSDVNGDPTTISYSWLLNGAPTIYVADRISGSLIHRGDVWTLSATPNDGFIDGNTVTQSVVIQNAAPTLSNHIITPSVVYNDSVVICTATASDPDETVTPNILWVIAGNIYNGNSIDLGTIDLGTRGLEPGDEITCRATAVDSDGASALSDSSQILINRDPVISDHSLSPNPLIANPPTNCLVSAYDPDGSNLTLDYNWLVNGQSVAQSSELVSGLIANDLVACEVTATDPHGGSINSTVSDIVQNAPPVVVDLFFTPGNPNVESLLSCQALATDAENDAITYTFTIENLTQGLSYTPSNTTFDSITVDLSSTAIQGGDELQCTVTATDSNNASGSDNIITTVSDTPPLILSNITISPQSAYTGDTLTCSFQASDPEDGALTTTYIWQAGGVPIGTGSQLAVTSSNSEVGQNIHCAAQAIDSSGNAINQTASVPVLNTPPIVTGTYISPYPTLALTDTAVCETQVIDPDETLTPSFVWTLNGLAVSSSQNLVLASVNAAAYDTISCAVTATDASGESDTESYSTSIINRPPTTPILEILPNNPIATEDDLLCSFVTPSNDLDGHPISYTYEWHRNGLPTVYNTDTVPATTTAIGEEWTCYATPNDGYDDGSYGIASTIIQSACSFGPCDSTISIGVYGIDLVEVSNGLFEMGSPTTEIGRQNREDLHYVYISHDLNVMTTEVTQGMFNTLMNRNPSFFGPTPTDTLNGGLRNCGPFCPVEYISWDEAADFANALTNYVNLTQGTNYTDCYVCTGSGANASCTVDTSVLTCSGYRLPTEAEWEYLARSGSSSAFWTPEGGGNIPNDVDPDGLPLTDSCAHRLLLDDGLTELDVLGYYCYDNIGQNGDSTYGTQEVALKAPNDFDLFDMTGNVREWTNDSYQTNLGSLLVMDPLILLSTTNSRVTRGGYWSETPDAMRSAARYSNSQSTTLNGIGFRLVQTK